MAFILQTPVMNGTGACKTSLREVGRIGIYKIQLKNVHVKETNNPCQINGLRRGMTDNLQWVILMKSKIHTQHKKVLISF